MRTFARASRSRSNYAVILHRARRVASYRFNAWICRFSLFSSKIDDVSFEWRIKRPQISSNGVSQRVQNHGVSRWPKFVLSVCHNSRVTLSSSPWEMSESKSFCYKKTIQHTAFVRIGWYSTTLGLNSGWLPFAQHFSGDFQGKVPGS